MATATLFEAISFIRNANPQFLTSNPLFSAQIPLRPSKPNHYSIKTLKIITKATKFHVHCSTKSKKCDPKLKNKEKIRTLIKEIVNLIQGLQKSAAAAVMLGFFLHSDPHPALAASGGRMGGNSIASRSSSSSSSQSTSYSSPSSSRSSDYSSSSYRSHSSYSPPIFSIEIPSYSYSVASPPLTRPAVGTGFSVGQAVFYVTVFLVVYTALRSLTRGATSCEKTSVVKLQVGLLGRARTLQKDLNQIAETADTSKPEGLSYILTETILALLRHQEFRISAYSSVKVRKSLEDGEKCFNQLTMEERGKFDEETLVNVNNIKRKSTRSPRDNLFSNEYIVITILVAAEGVYELPTINSNTDLKEALQKLGSIPSRKTMAVEVLWTPQNEDDTLVEQQLHEDYPLLRLL